MEMPSRLLHLVWIWLIYLPFIAITMLLTAVTVVIVTPLFGARRVSRWTAEIWARAVVKLLPARVEFHGAWPLTDGAADDSGDSYIVVANHQSQFDIPVLYGWLGLDLRWVMKREVMRIPGIGFGAKALGHIPIDRRDGPAARAAIKQALDSAGAGTGMMFFPEGTRSRDGSLLKFKSGAFRIAIQQQMPLLPVAICGTRNIMPPGSFNLHSGTIHVVVREPIDTRGMDETQVDELIRDTRQWIQQQLDYYATV